MIGIQFVDDGVFGDAFRFGVAFAQRALDHLGMQMLFPDKFDAPRFPVFIDHKVEARTAM